MKKFMTAVFFLSVLGLALNVACLDSKLLPSKGDYVAFMVIGIVLIILATVSSYGAGLTDIQEQKTTNVKLERNSK